MPRAKTQRPLSAPARRRLQRSLGVTRVARVTGLDRTGVEVACAVRPGGHVLQVTNGKGHTFEEASAGALLEAAELHCAERVDPMALVFGSMDELEGRWPGEVWGAHELGSAGRLAAPELWSRRTRIAWRPARDLFSGEEVLVPAQALHCPPAGSPPLGPAVVAWSTNGGGAHPDRSRALLHALLEAVERDQLARALPRGWTAPQVAARLVPAAALTRLAPACARIRDRMAAAGLEAFLFDLAPRRGGLGLPVAGAVLVAPDFGPVPITAGYACRADLGDALAAALLEAAQSRLTDIHGARDDVRHGPAPWAKALLAACRSAKGRAPERPTRPASRASPSGAVARILGALASAGFSRAAAVDLAPAGLGVHVVRVVVPGFLMSELL